MAGFKTVSGVEKSRDKYLEDLQKLLIEFHPFKYKDHDYLYCYGFGSQKDRIN